MDNVSDDHLREIGRVSVNFSRLESLVEFFVWSLVEVPNDEAMAVVTQGDNFAALLSKLKRLVPVCIEDPDLQRKAEEWIGFARKANELRIDAIHSNWFGTDGEEAMVLRVTKSGDILGALRSAGELRQHAELIDRIVQEGQRLLEVIKPDAFP